MQNGRTKNNVKVIGDAGTGTPKSKVELKNDLVKQLQEIEQKATKEFEKEYWELCEKHNRMYALGQFIYSAGKVNANLGVAMYEASLNPFKKVKNGK